MAIERVPGTVAWENVRKNEFSRYPKPNKTNDRLFPFASPQVKPSFDIAKDDKIFTIGSCFARSVDDALQAAGWAVHSRPEEVVAAARDRGRDDGIFNKYTVHSILNELRWVTSETHPGELAYIQTGEDSWFDPQLGGQTYSSSLDELMGFRELYSGAISSFKTSDIVIVTLGLAETWYDNHSKLYLNCSPSKKICEKYPGRFELHVMDYDEIFEALQAIWQIVDSFGKEGVRILITVSPVALNTTFRSQDILVGNMYSKAVQRAACEAFVSKYENVDYFPSFETVILSNPRAAWVPKDYRHVAPAMVRKIMRSVLENYTYSIESVDLQEKQDQINMLYKQNDLEAISVFIDEEWALQIEDVLVCYRLGLACKKIKNNEGALKFFNRCLELDRTHIDSARNAVQAAWKLGNAELLKGQIEVFVSNFPNMVEDIKKYRA